jgi:DNA gyrase subunit B
MPAKKTTTYTAEDIAQLRGLEAIRKLPGMYIGNNSVYGLHHLLLEVVDNAIDEAMAGYCDAISVTIHKDGSVTVEDNGRGIPVEVKPEKEQSALTLALTELHTGGKFEGGSYSASGGLHGIGIKATNAYSEFLEVKVHRDGVVYRQRFEEGGELASEVEIIRPKTDQVIGRIGEKDAAKVIKANADKSLGTGTKVTFRPNREWFDPAMEWPKNTVPWDFNRLTTRFQQMAVLNSGITIQFADQRGRKKDRRKRTFYYEQGLMDYVRFLVEGETPLFSKPLHFAGQNEEGSIVVEVALQYAGDNTQIYSFVNSIYTPDGGTAVAGFQAGLTKALNQFAGEMRQKVKSIKGEDALLGLTAVISVRMTETPQFNSQTKNALTSPHVQGVALSVVYENLLAIFRKKKAVGRAIVKQCEAALKGREAAKQARRLVMRRSALDVPEAGVLGKLADVSKGTDVGQTILYIVEGDSAGGSCKMARDRRHHAIMPLRGKPLNTKMATLNKALSNAEIKAVIAAIGAGVGADFNLEEMRYGGVAVLTDADVDGHHIKCLLLAFFWLYMRPLVEAGRLYVAEAPLYQIREKKGKRKRSQYAYSDEEKDEIVKAFGGPRAVEVQRYKGLGEMNPEQLQETIFTLIDDDDANPVLNEHIVQFEVDDVHHLNVAINALMGRSAERRKHWLFQRWEQGENGDAEEFLLPEEEET